MQADKAGAATLGRGFSGWIWGSLRQGLDNGRQSQSWSLGPDLALDRREGADLAA